MSVSFYKPTAYLGFKWNSSMVQHYLAYVPVTSTAIFRWIADKMWILTNVIGYLLLLIQTTLHNLFLNFLPIMNLSCQFPELFDYAPLL